MKRILFVSTLILVSLLSMGTVPDNAVRVKEFRITAGDATNPQTISWLTTYGYYATSWTTIASGGGVTLKIHGAAGTHPSFWLYVPSGATFTMPVDAQQPIDTVIVLRDATSSGLYIVGSGKP